MPQPETYAPTPGSPQTQASLEMSEQIVPGLLAHHPMGALVGQECVRIWAAQFCSMIFSVQYRLPATTGGCSTRPITGNAYRYHRIFLQHLQSGVPGQWLLKSPAHLWQLDTLVAEYPDALIVQTHRDPLNVISSISALTHHVRRLASDHGDIGGVRAAVVRGDRRRTRALRWRFATPACCRRAQIVDVQFADFIRDPFATIRDLYVALGRELTPLPSSGCATSSPRTPATAAAGATPGRTPGWTPARCGSRSRIPGPLRGADRAAEVASTRGALSNSGNGVTVRR